MTNIENEVETSQEDRIAAIVEKTANQEEVVETEGQEVPAIEGADTTETPQEELGISTPVKNAAETLRLYREKNNQQAQEAKTKDAEIAELKAQLEKLEGKETVETEVEEVVETVEDDKPQDVQALIDAALAKRDAATQVKADEAKLVETVEAFMEASKITNPDKVVEFFDYTKETLGIDLVKNPNVKAMEAIWNGGTNESFKAKLEQQVLLDIKNGKVKPSTESKKITETTETKKLKQQKDKFDKDVLDIMEAARNLA